MGPNPPLFQTPDQLKQYWRDTGQQGLDFLDDNRPQGISDSDTSSSAQSTNGNQANTAQTVVPPTSTNDAASVTTTPVAAPAVTTTPVAAPAVIKTPVAAPAGIPAPPDPNSVQNKQKVNPRVSVQNSTEQQNSEQLNRLSALLHQTPTKNQFKDFATPDPMNSDFSEYRLPDYLALYTKDLLLRINMSQSDLPIKLYPYIEFDPTLNRFAPDITKLTLPTIQKLDHLFNNDKPPNLLTKLTDKVAEKVNKRHNKSNEP